MHIVKVEDGFNKMQELKVRAEAADVAKSQVELIFLLSVVCLCDQAMTCGYCVTFFFVASF